MKRKTNKTIGALPVGLLVTAGVIGVGAILYNHDAGVADEAKAGVKTASAVVPKLVATIPKRPPQLPRWRSR